MRTDFIFLFATAAIIASANAFPIESEVERVDSESRLKREASDEFSSDSEDLVRVKRGGPGTKTGLLAGAATGFAVGGPLGAVAGGAIGALGGHALHNLGKRSVPSETEAFENIDTDVDEFESRLKREASDEFSGESEDLERVKRGGPGTKTGLLAGAATGFAVGGPLGAVAGGAIGALGGHALHNLGRRSVESGTEAFEDTNVFE